MPGGTIDFFNELADIIKKQKLPHLLIISTKSKSTYNNTIRADFGDENSMRNFQIVLSGILEELNNQLDGPPPKKRRRRRKKTPPNENS